MVYEAVLLFGIYFSACFLFDVLTQNFNAASIRNWRQLFLFVVVGIYFTYFWGRTGQTLPMQTWRIKLVSANQQAITFKQACLRYCCAWMWFLPSLAFIYLFGIQHWPSIIIIFVGMIAWACTVKLDKNGQFLHDKIAGTQLISLPKEARISDTE
ncbi:RDD family [Solimicrobium silvestre]|uniref:RDD family n=2 Tax=Solimicrobium silvestre TaxID=2099400 RepID=A0A2S9GVX8_9BURK|nr:RDD family [Solimicrobium silvestre]